MCYSNLAILISSKNFKETVSKHKKKKIKKFSDENIEYKSSIQ